MSSQLLVAELGWSELPRAAALAASPTQKANQRSLESGAYFYVYKKGIVLFLGVICESHGVLNHSFILIAYPQLAFKLMEKCFLLCFWTSSL